MNKIIVAIIAVVALGAGALVLFQPKKSDAPPQFSWQFTGMEPDASSGAPRTKVSLKTDGKVREIGTYDGSCSEIAGSSWTFLPGESTGVICWWAGGGKEVGVFEEKGKLVVKVGDLDEGTEETPGLRGNFTTLFGI